MKLKSDTDLPEVTHLETTGEFVANLRKTIAENVASLSDNTIKSDRFITFILSLRNNWTKRIISGVSLHDLLLYIEGIREYMPLLPEDEKIKIIESIDRYKNKDFWYDTIIQMGISPESIISSLLQYPNKEKEFKFRLSGSIPGMDNSTFVSYVLASDMSTRFTNKLKRNSDKDEIRESREQLAEAFNILNIYWHAPLVQKSIEEIESKNIKMNLFQQYIDLKNMIEWLASIWEESNYTLDSEIRRGMKQYYILVEDIKDYLPHPSVLTWPASEWTLR
jgi:hypothetical protein